MCHFTQRVGLNLCGIFLLFFSARVLNYAAADIRISYDSTCFKTTRGTELSALLTDQCISEGTKITATGNKSGDK